MKNPAPTPQDTKQPGVKLATIKVTRMRETGRIVDDIIEETIRKRLDDIEDIPQQEVDPPIGEQPPGPRIHPRNPEHLSPKLDGDHQIPTPLKAGQGGVTQPSTSIQDPPPPDP